MEEYGCSNLNVSSIDRVLAVLSFTTHSRMPGGVYLRPCVYSSISRVRLFSVSAVSRLPLVQKGQQAGAAKNAHNEPLETVLGVAGHVDAENE